MATVRARTTFAPSPYFSEAQAGARELDRQEQERLRREQMAIERAREERVERMAAVHQKVIDSTTERKAHEAEVKAMQRMDAENRMPHAIDEISKIDPQDPKAASKLADVEARYWQLHGHGRNDMPTLDPWLAETRKQIESFSKTQAAKQAIDDKMKAADMAAASKYDANVSRAKNPPDGMAFKEMGPNGPVFVPKQEKAQISPAESSRLKKEFRTARANYEGAIGAVADPDATTLTTAQLIQKQRNKQLMQEAADELVSSHPELADTIKKQVKDSVLHDHDILASKLSGETDAKKIAQYSAALNPLKEELGFWKLNDKGKPIDAAGQVIDTSTPEGKAKLAAPPPWAESTTKAPVVHAAKPAPAVAPPVNPSNPTPSEPPAAKSPEPEAAPVSEGPTPAATPPVEPQDPVAPVSSPAPTGAVSDASVPAATPHPLEGQKVKHKASGQTGTILNGQFVPDS